jgi:hypothetical protein
LTLFPDFISLERLRFDIPIDFSISSKTVLPAVCDYTDVAFHLLKSTTKVENQPVQ